MFAHATALREGSRPSRMPKSERRVFHRNYARFHVPFIAEDVHRGILLAAVLDRGNARTSQIFRWLGCVPTTMLLRWLQIGGWKLHFHINQPISLFFLYSCFAAETCTRISSRTFASLEFFSRSAQSAQTLFELPSQLPPSFFTSTCRSLPARNTTSNISWRE